MGPRRKLWASVVLVVGLKVARACIAVGMWFARKGDRIGNRVLGYVERLDAVPVGERQQARPEYDQDDDYETPDERHGRRTD